MISALMNQNNYNNSNSNNNMNENGSGEMQGFVEEHKGGHGRSGTISLDQ